MTLVVTPGDVNADSYLSLADYRAACMSLGLAYSVKTDDVEEAAGRRSARWLDAMFRHKWPGERANGRGQALEWPRVNATDVNKVALPGGTIPVEITNAQVFAWYYESISPMGLTPTVKGSKEKMLTKAEGLEWKPLYTAKTLEDLRPTLFLVQDALSSLISFRSVPFFGVV